MARYFAIHATTWHTVPETLGNIMVAVSASGVMDWAEAKQVDVCVGGGVWKTVWKITTPTTPVVTSPTYTTHTITTTATIAHGVASWYVPAGRTVIRQTLTYYTGLSSNPHKYMLNVAASHRHESVIATGWSATVRYTYR